MSKQDKDLNLHEESIDKSQFVFVHEDKKLYDKKFQTKPIGYFKDAMIRFAKNKTNVFASSILALLILFSIFVPIFSTKNTETLEYQVAQLPPRIPFLEKFGIADGTASYELIPISYDNPYVDADGNHIDGLYLPQTELSEFIEEGSLTNQVITCTDKDGGCEGGVVQFQISDVDQAAGFYAIHPEPGVDQEGNPITEYIPTVLESIYFPTQLLIELKIDTTNSLNDNVLDGTAAFKVYFQLQPGGDDEDAEKTLIEVFDSSDASTYDSYADGLFSVDVADHPELFFGSLTDFSARPENYRVIVAYESPTKDSGVLEYFRVHVEVGSGAMGEDGPNEDDYIYSSGYLLSQYKIATDIVVENPDGDDSLLFAGSLARAGAERLTASYTLDAYARAFGPVLRIGFPGSEFQELMESCTYADGTEYDFENPVPGKMDENCAIYELIERNDEDAVPVPGKGTFYTYDVYLNYRVYAGYDELPYYLFGTSAAGYDMVKLIWIGLRTSLLIGFIVSFVNIAIGVVYGAISGYYGGQVDIIMQRFAEIVGRIPWLVTLSIFMAYFEAGFTSLILILIVSGWIGVSSITRTQFYRYKGREYVLASRTLGAKDGRLIFRHILPNGIGTIITSSILLIPTVIFSEATLSYLGFGIGHGQSFSLFGIDALTLDGVSIGVLLNDGRNKLRNYPHLTIFPAIIISILMITFNMFGNALRDAFNPALRGSE